jgi:hypothetical protein
VAYQYDMNRELEYGEELKKIRDMGIASVLYMAIGKSKEQLPPGVDPWSVARFVISPADGIADYIYDNEAKCRFRMPAAVILILIKYGDVVILPSTIVRRERVISELKSMLNEAMKELQDIERKLRRKRSQILEKLREMWRSDVEKITKALEYLSST